MGTFVLNYEPSLVKQTTKKSVPWHVIKHQAETTDVFPLCVSHITVSVAGKLAQRTPERLAPAGTGQEPVREEGERLVSAPGLPPPRGRVFWVCRVFPPAFVSRAVLEWWVTAGDLWFPKQPEKQTVPKNPVKRRKV